MPHGVTELMISVMGAASAAGVFWPERLRGNCCAISKALFDKHVCRRGRNQKRGLVRGSAGPRLRRPWGENE